MCALEHQRVENTLSGTGALLVRQQCELQQQISQLAGRRKSTENEHRRLDCDHQQSADQPRRTMATQEQVQEALQRFQAQEARIVALETQLQNERARAQTAEHERSALIQTLVTMRQERGGAMVDTKGITQLMKGGAEQDFSEWTHKVRTFMLARFGNSTLETLTWAARQRRIVVKACVQAQRDRFVPWIVVFVERADETDRIDGIDDFVGKLCAYLVSFTTDAANWIVRNAGEGNGLEAWRRLHGEYDPTSSMRRVAVLQQVQNSSQMPARRGSGSSTGRLAPEVAPVQDVHRP